MDESQIILIGLVASLITWGLKIASSYAGYQPGRVVLNVTLYAISVFFAVQWSGAALPMWPAFDGDVAAFAAAVWGYLNAWIALGTPILGSASLIYNLLYERVALPAYAKLAKKAGSAKVKAKG